MENSPIFSGSSRILLHKETQAQIQGVNLKYSVEVYQDLRNLFSIIPPDTFCGPNETIPGIKNRRISPSQPIILEKGSNLMINHIAIVQGYEIEQKVLVFAERYQKETLLSNDTRKPRVQERKVLVGTHNT